MNHKSVAAPQTKSVTTSVPSKAVITGGNPDQGRKGEPFVNTVVGGVDAVSYASNNLPKGLSIDQRTGEISGSPLEAGKTATIIEVGHKGGKITRHSLGITVS